MHCRVDSSGLQLGMMIDARPDSESLSFTSVPHHGDQRKRPEDRLAFTTRRTENAERERIGTFERLGCSAQSWQIQIEKLRGDRLLGRFFAVSRAKLREIRERLGVRRLVNLQGCPM